MVMRWRQLMVFGGGLLLGVAAGAALFVAAQNWQQAQDESAATAQQRSAGAAPVQACTDAPLLAAAGAQDGQFGSPADAVDKTLSDIAAYASVGSDAAAQGRVRDAEVSLISACRIAGHLGGGQSQHLADAMFQLGRHYMAVAAADPGDSLRPALLGRAESLLARSMEVFAALHGQPHEKTRLAASALTLARQAQALATTLQAAAAQEAVAAASSAPAPVSPALARGPALAASNPDAAETTAMGGPPAPKPRRPRPQPQPEAAEPSEERTDPVMRARPAPRVQADLEPQASPATGSAQVETPSEPEFESP
jgi:hypothetical protein